MKKKHFFVYLAYITYHVAIINEWTSELVEYRTDLSILKRQMYPINLFLSEFPTEKN